ncbi:hypothetical protein Phi19:2_gp072 [Cellulophaga phage phi19:2]|uniref:Lipoprotein n=3 Tax=Cellulophaga phage phiST TaxID=756282 RepID=M4SPR7_9CAUD|nr:hypothetical protein CGPG_00037 [Cellulophaga phage phiST]AGH56736.1 hypothetical protein CGPG_00037 [Cellulophaga phage phiST]AGO47211.1 hypothetical protein PhiST_gp072 [Cellulophaga phage phiST]AGO48707.1 hypothetical protein Phi19:2_gp072 [Cellulophaga phage phi19:2]AGO49077.1 hypothetical protein Phi13:1_gp066 [Cellulophaga phage phi13:1]
MIKLKNKLSNAFYILIVAVSLFSCEGGETKTETTETYVTVIVEDCEYIFKDGTGYKGMTHKGNCKNVIHNCN